MLGFFFNRYEEKLKERLARRRERLAQGLPVDDEDEEDLEDGLAEGEEVTDVKAILEDLDKRYIQTSERCDLNRWKFHTDDVTLPRSL